LIIAYDDGAASGTSFGSPNPWRVTTGRHTRPAVTPLLLLHAIADGGKQLLEARVGGVAEILAEALGGETVAEAVERRKERGQSRFARQPLDVDRILLGHAGEFDAGKLGGQRGKVDAGGASLGAFGQGAFQGQLLGLREGLQEFG